MNIKSNKILFVDFLSEYENSNVFSVGCYGRKNAINVKEQRIKSELVLDYQNSLLGLVNGLSTYEGLTLKASGSQLYSSVIEPLFKWILAIEKAIDKYKPSYLDFGKFYGTKAIYTYEAEGEVNKKWMYESNYYLPNLILPLIKSKYPHIYILSEEISSFKVYKNFYLRNLIYLTGSHLIAINRWARGLFVKTQNIKVKNKIGLLVRSQVQTDFALNLYKHFEGEFYLLNYEQVGNLNTNRNYLSSLKQEFIDLNKKICFWDIVKSFLKGGLSLFQRRHCVELKLYNGELSLPMEYVLQDIYIRSLDFKLYSMSIKEYKKNSLISFDMLTPQPHYIASIVGRNNILQMQTTLMNGKPQANFIAGNFFVHTDPISYKGMCEENPHLKSKLLLIDTPKALKKNFTARKNEKLKRVIYFSQPVELEIEKIMLLKLQSILASNDIEFYIKIHPRQKKVNYSFLKNTKIVDSEVDTDFFDLALTRNSSIAIDCWIANLPIVFVRETDFMQSIDANYLPKDYIGDLKKVEELLNIINTYDDFVTQYRAFREKMGLHVDDEHMLTTIKKGLSNEA